MPDMFALNRNSLWRSVTLATVLCLHAITYAQVNTAGTAGNEVIQGRIHFPAKYPSVMRPVVKLQSTSSSELKTVADADGNFSFTHLRPDSYTILVDGGNEYENASETVAIGSPGPVPAQGNPSQYAIPVTYQVHIYLQPKKTYAVDYTSEATRAALANVSTAARDSFNKGVESARLGETAKAIEQFREAISQAPNFALAYNEMGVQYLKLGQANKAAAALAEAVKLIPQDFAARLNYGIALLNLKRFGEAEKQVRQALQINEAAATAHYYLALALLNQHEFETAESQFEVSIKSSNDQIAQAHKYLGGIYWRNKQYKRAADELERYITLDPNAPDRVRIRDTIKDLRSRN
ncbi:MAG TPA: tetratricopeptide repeat protein [Pyrinomonadaceae bacterium]|nr:tetratricopeptide repeat protein [Pyrinomonadaceae bacterium]